MDTAEVLISPRGKQLHLLGSAAADMPVSSRSLWRDDRWVLDNSTPGVGAWASTLKWDVELPDGSVLTDEANASVLDWLKRFAWSLYADPGDGPPHAPGSAPTLSLGIRTLISWMITHGASRPEHLTPALLDGYLRDLPEILGSDPDADVELDDLADHDDEGVSQSQVWSRVNIVILLWKQRHVLAKAGISPIPAEPWDGRSALDISSHVATRALGWIPPLPDEVTIPLLNKATWFLGQPAEDIIAAHNLAHSSYASAQGNNRGDGTSKSASKERQRRAIGSFTFSVLPGESTPWHPTLPEWSAACELDVPPAQRLRQLVQSLVAACSIVILAGTGMRISELCGLPAGLDPETGLPDCVRVEVSPSGLNKLYLVRSQLKKGEEVGREVDWVIGLEPLGSERIPPTIQAMLILERLLDQYRPEEGKRQLFMSLRRPRGLPKRAGSVKTIRSDNLRWRIKDFIAEWVDLSALPDESARRVVDKDLVPWRQSRGRVIKTHQFRKMFADFALSIDPRLLPALQTHFHHLDQAITEGGYWGKNRAQVEPLSTVRAQQINQTLFDLVTGRGKIAGRMGEHLEANLDELRARVIGKLIFPRISGRG